MSRFLIVLAAVVVLAMAVSNPSMADFDQFVQARSEALIEDEVGDSAMGRAMARLGASLAGGLAAATAERHNYGLFSTYVVGDASDGWSFLGVGGRFIQLRGPDDSEGG